MVCIKPFLASFRLTVQESGGCYMYEWSFSATAEMVVGMALVVVMVALVFV
jgi:hypothetical protein